jgi:hypothetical protein
MEKTDLKDLKVDRYYLFYWQNDGTNNHISVIKVFKRFIDAYIYEIEMIQDITEGWNVNLNERMVWNMESGINVATVYELTDSEMLSVLMDVV